MSEVLHFTVADLVAAIGGIPIVALVVPFIINPVLRLIGGVIGLTGAAAFRLGKGRA